MHPGTAASSAVTGNKPAHRVGRHRFQPARHHRIGRPQGRDERRGQAGQLAGREAASTTGGKQQHGAGQSEQGTDQAWCGASSPGSSDENSTISSGQNEDSGSPASAGAASSARKYSAANGQTAADLTMPAAVARNAAIASRPPDPCQRSLTSAPIANVIATPVGRRRIVPVATVSAASSDPSGSRSSRSRSRCGRS